MERQIMIIKIIKTTFLKKIRIGEILKIIFLH